MYSRTSDSGTTGIPSPQNIRGIPLEGHHPIRCRDERRRTVRLLYQHVPEVQARGEWPSRLDQDPRRCQRVYQLVFRKRRGIPRRGENRIEKNPGMRALAKLCLNSFWGKFGQRLNLKQSQFFHETEVDAFFRVLSDPTKDVQDFHIVANDTIQVEWTYKKDCQPEDNKTNIYLATFTTCWARLKLYSILEKIDRNVLYYDTDSVIFVGARHLGPEVTSKTLKCHTYYSHN